MRIAWTSALCLLAGCAAERLSAPVVEAVPAAGPAEPHIRTDSTRLASLTPEDIERIEIIRGPLYKTIGCTATIIVTTKPHAHALDSAK